MKPIEKNIIVIDEQGNKFEATYPKRAKGLVKNGRARFVNDSTICLACPPKNILEDNKMNDNIDENAMSVETIESIPAITVDYVFKQIEKIANQASKLSDAIPEISGLTTHSDDSDTIEIQTKAITDIILCRETTNQQLLKLYEKMYDDLKPQKQYENIEHLLDSNSVIVSCVEAIKNSEVDSEDISNLISDMYGSYEASRRWILEKLTIK